MIQPINFNLWRNAEFLSYLTQVSKLLKAFNTGSAPAVFTSSLAGLDAAIADLELLFKQDPQSPGTARLKDLDARRDGLVTGVSLLCRAYTTHEDDEVRAAASLLLHSLSVYGPRVARQDYPTQTVSIRALLSDWKNKPELAGAITAVPGLANWLPPLATTNEAFDQAYLDRNEKTAEAQMPFEPLEKEKHAIDAYRAVVRKINGFCDVSENAKPWIALANSIEELADTYRNNLAIREGKSATAAAANKPA
jgi:hypothetical protein